MPRDRYVAELGMVSHLAAQYDIGSLVPTVA